MTRPDFEQLFGVNAAYAAKVYDEYLAAPESVPEEWVPPSPGSFQADVMNQLADLGEQMGADPTRWRTEPP